MKWLEEIVDPDQAQNAEMSIASLLCRTTHNISLLSLIWLTKWITTIFSNHNISENMKLLNTPWDIIAQNKNDFTETRFSSFSSSWSSFHTQKPGEICNKVFLLFQAHENWTLRLQNYDTELCSISIALVCFPIKIKITSFNTII